MPTGIPEPWNTLLLLVIGPVGAMVALCIIIYFLWRLYREEQRENRENFKTVTIQSKAIEMLTIEIKAWRQITTGSKNEPD